MTTDPTDLSPNVILKDVSDAERAEFRDAFKLFDKDGDGKVTVDEIHEVFTALGFKKFSKRDIKKMVAQIDIDGNGTIDLDEFIVLMRSKRTGKNKNQRYENELRAAFNVFDADGSGDIDAQELAAIMQALGEKLTTEDIQFMIRSVDIVEYSFLFISPYLIAQGSVFVFECIHILIIHLIYWLFRIAMERLIFQNSRK